MGGVGVGKAGPQANAGRLRFARRECVEYASLPLACARGSVSLVARVSEGKELSLELVSLA